MSVSFCTFCHPPRYVKRLHEPGVLRAMVESHGWDFDRVIVIHNQCRAGDYPPLDFPCATVDLHRDEFDEVLRQFRVNPDNPEAERLTHGEGAAHWWKVHVVNHLCGLHHAGSDFTDRPATEFIVFADCDTRIKSQPSSWVAEGISILRNKPEVLIVSPGDGGENGGPAEGGKWPDGTRLTRCTSQQLFLCRTREFKETVDFDVPWNGQFDGPWGPLQEWYFMLEGRMSRYMRDRSDQWRAVLPDRFRYWHNSYWATEREAEGWD